MSEINYDNVVNYLPKMSEKVTVPDEKFLFFFDPEIVDEKFLFGLSLNTGVYIFGIFALIQVLSSLFKIFDPDSFWMFVISIFLFAFYLVIAFYAFLGVINKNYQYLKISYLVVSFIFIIEAIIYVLKSLYRIIEFISPWEREFLQLKFLIYVFGYGVYLLIFLYLIYILYKYMLQVKNGQKNEDNANATDKKDDQLIINQESNEKKE